jgi:hypothetical protein
VQEAAIRLNRKRIQTLYREKKRLSQLNRPSILQGEDGEADAKSGSSSCDKEAEAAIEKEKKMIKAIQH